MSKRQIKRNNKKEIKSKSESYYNNEFKTLAIIVGVIVLIFVVVYLVIGIFVTKEIKLFQSDDGIKTPATIQYTTILAGETFNQSKEEYYVIFADSDGVNYPIYETIISNNSDKNIYLVDMANSLNKSYLAEEGNSNVQNITELKVKNDTIIKVKNKSNVLYLEGKDNIINEFK